MKIIVTGAAGFIGFHFTQKILEMGHQVVGMDNINDYYDVNLKYGRLKDLGFHQKDIHWNRPNIISNCYSNYGPNHFPEQLFTFVKYRPDHNFRYAMNASKMNRQLGWKPTVTFEEGLEQTIDWYFDNKDWLQQVTSGDYQNYYYKQYS